MRLFLEPFGSVLVDPCLGVEEKKSLSELIRREVLNLLSGSELTQGTYPVERADEYLAVTVKETAKRPSEVNPSPFQVPFHVVAVPKSHLSAKFELIIEDSGCVIKRTPWP